MTESMDELVQRFNATRIPAGCMMPSFDQPDPITPCALCNRTGVLAIGGSPLCPTCKRALRRLIWRAA